MLQDRESGGMKEPDEYAVAVPRFHSCLRALSRVMESKLPLIVVVQSNKCVVLTYEFADASGSSFGSTLLVKKKYIIESAHGAVLKIPTPLTGVEEVGGARVILATNNEVVEHLLYKCNCTSDFF